MVLICLTGPAAARPSFSDAVAAAWSIAPDQLSLNGQRQAAEARASAGHALLPDAPSLTTTYDDDHFIGSNEGYTTYEGTLSTPVWLPGEGGATVRNAEAEVARIEATGRARHLAVAREVLDEASSALMAQEEASIASRRLRDADALSAEATRLVRVGEQPLIDAQAVEGDQATASIAASDAEARLEAARSSLRVLTGLDQLPDLAVPASLASLTRAAPTEAAIEAAPAMLAAEQAVRAADANLRLVRIGDRADPEVGLQVIREKQFGSPWDTRVGVQVVIPFASRARDLPRIAAAESARAEAEAGLERTRRTLVVELARAWSQLAAARRASREAGAAERALASRAREIERAWRLGEMPLIEVIRAQAVAADAAATSARSAVLTQAASWRLALAEGILP